MSDIEKYSIPLNITIKREKITPPKTTPPEEKPSVFGDEKSEEKKSVQPVKSSNEILAELFKVFNAAPPEELLNGEFKKEKSKHKHKKNKKRKHGSESDSDGSPSRKKKKSKKSKKESSDSSDNSNDSHEKKKRKKKKKKSKSHKSEKSEEKVEVEDKKNIDDFDLSITSLKTESSKANTVKSRITISNLKNSTILQESNYKEKKSKSKPERLSPQRRSESSELSLSDEDSLMFPVRKQSSYFEGNKYYDRSQRNYSSGSRSQSHYNSSSRRSRDREYNQSSRSSHRDNYHQSRSYRDYHRHRTVSRSRSRSTERIDKKRLLEIARKNAITMLKSGTLPGSQHLAPEIKEKALEKMRYGGKTIEELTEYCRKLSNGEGLGELSSVSDEDSDHDKDGNDKAFQHPFVIKERGPIVMNIKNSVPIPPKSAEQTKAILMQFPVSSGQHHRLNESEWVPVEPKAPEALPKKTPHANPLPTSTNSSNTSSISAIQPSPVTTKFDTSNFSKTQIPQPTILPNPTPQVEQQLSIIPTQQSISAAEQGSIDIASVITQRLNAMRKLQENPNDNEAKKLMSCAQQNMTAWVNSKYTGQFTGSTGATILSAKELASGYQPWVKKDQFITTTPVSGGMGMHLLQKMGWKPGEGLGKDKTGSLEPLLLEVKLDKKGLLANEENPQHIIQRKKGAKAPVKISKKTLETKHPVSLLGELSAKKKWQSPMYEVVSESGPGHNRNFVFKVVLNGVEYTPTEGAANKKEAKSIAAKCCLQQLGILPT